MRHTSLAIIAAACGIALASGQAAAECEAPGITDKGENGCAQGFRYRRVENRLGGWSYKGLRPGTKEWKFIKIAGPTPLEEHDLCGGAPAVTATLKLKHTGTDSTAYTLEAGISISAEAKAGINAGIETSLGIKTSADFKAGKTTTTTTSDEIERTWTTTFPTDTHWRASGEAWGWDEKTVLLDFRRDKQQRSYCCSKNDSSCDAGAGDNPDAPWTHCDWVTPVSTETSPGQKKLLWMAKSTWEKFACPVQCGSDGTGCGYGDDGSGSDGSGSGSGSDIGTGSGSSIVVP